MRRQSIAELERLWYAAERRDQGFAGDLLHLIDRLGDRYEVEELAAGWAFTGREPLTVERAIEVKLQLETIEKLLEQLREAKKDAKIGIIDLDELKNFVDEADIDGLRQMGEQIREMIRRAGGGAGPRARRRGWVQPHPQGAPRLPGEAARRDLQRSRGGAQRAARGPIEGEGVVELPKTRSYEFGDAASHIDVTQTLINAAARGERTAVGPPAHPRGRHRRPPDAQHPEVRDLPARRHVGLDGADGPVHPVQADGDGDGRADPQRVPGRLPAHDRDRDVRAHRPAGGDHLAHAQARHGPRPGRAPPRGHGGPRGQRVDGPPALHEHPARPEPRAPAPRERGHAEQAGRAVHRRPAHGALRERSRDRDQDGPAGPRREAPLHALPPRPAHGAGDDARGDGVRARGDHDQRLPAAKSGARTRTTSRSRSASRSRRRGACSSWGASRSTASCSGTT
jgi:hypothetical protein